MKLTEKRTADFTKKHWDKFIHNSFIISFKKKLLLFGTQIIIATIFNKQSSLLFVFVSFISVLFSAYYLNSITFTSSSILPFKISLISIFNQSFHLLWNAVDCHPYVSVEEQDFSTDQIKDVWYISNEFQLQLYTQWEL